MNKTDNIGMVASSLAAVIRQSLNAPFRKECYLLLGVTNNRDAQDAMYSLLNARELKKRPGIKDNGGTSSQGLCLEEDTDDQNPNFQSLECDNVEETRDPSAEEKLTTSKGWLESTWSSHDLGSNPPAMSAAKSNLEPQKNVMDVEPADMSDDETQLDWDVQP